MSINTDFYWLNVILRTLNRVSFCLVSVMRPHAENFNRFRLFIYFIDKTVLNIDSSGISVRFIYQLFIGRLKWIAFQYFKQSVYFGFQTACQNFLIIFFRLFCKEDFIFHFKSFFQSSFVHSEIGVLIPSSMDSLMPGIP